MTNPDTILWQSARNLLDSQENFHKLYAAFYQLECGGDGLTIEWSSEEDSGGDFFKPVWNTYYDHFGSARANAKLEGIVTIALQLTADEGTEADWPYGKRSKVLVGYSGKISLEDPWGFTTSSPNQAGYFEGCVARELLWYMEYDKGSWFYAVPLDLLTSTSRVRELIVAPVHEILCGGTEDVFGLVDASLAKIKDSLCLPPKPRAAG